jgi:hypothetical protein
MAQTAAPGSAANIVSPDNRAAAGKAPRDKIPRGQHGGWKPTQTKDWSNPIDILHKSDGDRITRLLPIRFGCTLHSPYPFYRGAAGAMTSVPMKGLLSIRPS